MYEDKYFPLMQKMTVNGILSYLELKQSILIPIGITEQHGYHLPLCTDALLAAKIAQQIGEDLKILVGPTVLESYSGGTLPGTINISPNVMTLVLEEILLSLSNQGFKNFYIILGHGGTENTLVMDEALKILLRKNSLFSDVMIAKLPFWEFDTTEIGWPKALNENDMHAGWYETSLMLALAPELVRMQEIMVDDFELKRFLDNKKICDDKVVYPHLSQRSDIKYGVIGNPEKATAEKGRAIFNNIINNMKEKISKLELGKKRL
jgi:creatinine amidohydrolase